MARYALGLVVGKFAPLHHGHEWLIQQAAAQCERLLVLSYTQPEFARCDVARRRQWLAARCPAHECLVIDDAWLATACPARGLPLQPLPANTAPDAVHQQWLAWLLVQVLQRRPDAFFCSEAYGPATAQTLSRAFGHPVAAEVLDPTRVHLPISATAIRQTPALARRWTAPEVASSWVRRIALLGGESTGKTTLAAALAQALASPWVAEYGRELWEQQGGLDEPDLLKIAQEQVRREDQAALAADDWLVCDTSPLTTWGYSHWLYGRADPALTTLTTRPYDAAVLCCPDFAFVQDGTRRDDAFRQQQHAWYLAQLQAGGVPWMLVAGDVAARVARVVGWIRGGVGDVDGGAVPLGGG